MNQMAETLFQSLLGQAIENLDYPIQYLTEVDRPLSLSQHTVQYMKLASIYGRERTLLRNSDDVKELNCLIQKTAFQKVSLPHVDGGFELRLIKPRGQVWLPEGNPLVVTQVSYDIR